MSWHIYSLTDPRDGRVRYVGKADDVKRRLCNHVSEALRGRKRNHRLNWIRSLVEGGQMPQLCILESGEGDWQAAEKRWIKNFRDAGYELVNSTDGGEGVEGCMRSVETCAKQSTTLKATLASPEARAKKSAVSKALWTPEYRAKMSAVRKAQWASPEYRAKMVEASRRGVRTPEHRTSKSTALKVLWQDPEFRTKMLDSRREACRSPEFRAKISAISKACWAKRKQEAVA